MLNRFFGPKTHDIINMFAVFVIAVGIPVNKVVMSLGTLLLAVNFLLNADFKSYWERSKKNLVFWFIILLVVFHLFGLFYTTDFSYALRDLNNKLPILAIPIVMVAYPIKKRFLVYIFYGFLIALLITSIVNFDFMVHNETQNYRNFSLFGSHIRYSLLVVTGILLSIYLLLRNKKWWFFYALLAGWFVYYTFVSQVFSGYVALVFLFLGCFIYFIRYFKNGIFKKTAILLLIGLFGLGGFQFYDYVTPDTSISDFRYLPTHSKYGEKYYNDTTSLWFENGHHILSCIAGDELVKAWNERSEVGFREKISSDKELKGVLFRYMSSKGLTKDKEGMESMTAQDIKNVEQGMTSIRFTYGPLKSRLVGLKNEFYHYSIGGDPDGNSLLQRFEHWRIGKAIIKENWLIGVGTGDLQQAFNEAYISSNTQLDEANWNRAHNQFMTFWISFGILGFLVFTGFWLWFLWRNIKLKNLIGIGFTLIAIGSFLSEDTIETQQGVTYIALFLGITAMMNAWKMKKEIEK